MIHVPYEGSGPSMNAVLANEIDLHYPAASVGLPHSIDRACRPFRIYEGPSEIHRWFIARDSLRNGLPAE